MVKVVLEGDVTRQMDHTRPISPASIAVLNSLKSMMKAYEQHWGKEHQDLKLSLVLEIVRSEHPLDVSSIAAVLERPRTTISRTLKDWEKKGMCKLIRQGRRMEIYPTEKLANIIEEFSQEIIIINNNYINRINID